MPNDAPIPPYEFEYVGGQNQSYSFVTDDRVRYEIRFVPSAYLFEDYLNAHINAHEMVIAVASNPAGGKLPADPRTAPTIRTIFYDFFQSKELVVVFICDTWDRREEARARKFTAWYYTDVQLHFFKCDARIPDGDRAILLSAILRDEHPHFLEIVQVFRELGRVQK